jgi:hypothetical protein
MSATGNALAARIRARRRPSQQWQHPAIAGKHEISVSREHAGADVYSVATCQCGWRSRVEVNEVIPDQARAIDGHWNEVIAAAAGGVAA